MADGQAATVDDWKDVPQGDWKDVPSKTTANNPVENATPKLEGSAFERGASGAASGAKAMVPRSVNDWLGGAVDVATGAAPLRAIKGAYDEYKHGRETGQGVIPSIAGAIGSSSALDTEGIRKRAAKGDVAGVVGESVPAIASVLLGGEMGRLGGARAGIAKGMYTPAGELTPGAEAIMHPTQLPEYVGRKLFPEPEEQIARREADTKYGQLGEDLMRRGEEQSKIDEANRLPIRARNEMYEDLASRRMNRGAEQSRIDAANEQRLREAETSRQKELADTERLRTQDAQSLMRRGDTAPPEPEIGSPENPGWLVKLPDKMPAVTPELGSPQNPGLMSRMPTKMPRGLTESLLGEPGTRSLARRGSPDDLISRTRALVRPGEEPSVGDLKRAGDLTQAPVERLRTLAKFGDKLAENELRRRLQH